MYPAHLIDAPQRSQRDMILKLAMDGARIVNGEYPAFGTGRDISVGIAQADDLHLAAHREVFSDL